LTERLRQRCSTEGAALLEKPYTVEDLKKALSGIDIDPQPSLT
jgi:hypothetical protein